MRVISLIDAPLWTLGVYGSLFGDRSATPFLDRLAGAGFTLDAVFVDESDASGVDLQPLKPDLQIACPIDAIAPGTIDQWLPANCFQSLCEDLLDEGVPADALVNPQTLAEQIAADQLDGLWDASLLLELDEAAQFQRAVALAQAAAADQLLASRLGRLDDVLAGEPTAILSLTRSGPPGVPTQPICDASRHVGLVFVGQNVPTGRDRAMFSLTQLTPLITGDSLDLTRLREIETEAIRFETATHQAVRTSEAFLVERRLPAEEDGGLDTRLFLKPDDRWNQFNVAGLEADILAATRDHLTPVG